METTQRTDRGAQEPRVSAEWLYAIGASLCCWYLPHVVLLFWGDPRPEILLLFPLLPGALLSGFGAPLPAVMFAAGAMVLASAWAWRRAPNRRAFIAAVTLVLASFNALVLGLHFAL